MLLIIDFHRYNEELTQVFMSCNLMGGMFQRLGKGTFLQIIKFIILLLCTGSSVGRIVHGIPFKYTTETVFLLNF
jgi:hypothetical protein